jgi:outer membrane lipoprotein LolB
MSCASRPVSPPLDGFQLKGKLAVSNDAERFSANFLWRFDGRIFDIDVWGPLGQGRVHLRGDGNELALIDGEGAVVRQGPQEEIMTGELGWSLPLEVFPAWVLGAPLQGLPSGGLQYNADGRLEAFTQLGWRINLDRYTEVELNDGKRWLPRRVRAGKGASLVRLVITRWQI